MSREIATGCNRPRVFLTADLHWGDERVAKARRFDNAKAMGTHIATRWDEAVGEGDIVYVLGDAAKRGHVKALAALKGEKHLICGNADDIAEATASGVFAAICVAKWTRGAILTHIPVHPSQLGAGVVNVHGHLHAATIPEPRYRCVSVEQTDYAPVVLESLRLHPRKTR